MQAEEKKTRTDLASLDPLARVRLLTNHGTMVEVDPNVPPRRYVWYAFSWTISKSI